MLYYCEQLLLCVGSLVFPNLGVTTFLTIIFQKLICVAYVRVLRKKERKWKKIRVINLWSHDWFVYGCLDTRKGSSYPRLHHLANPVMLWFISEKNDNHVHSKLLFLFFTSSTYLISVSFLLFIHLTLFIQTLLTNHESSLPLTHHQPQPLQTPTPPLLVKTYVKSYFPLIKYSSVLQMYAWITCHTLSLLRMAPRWCS